MLSQFFLLIIFLLHPHFIGAKSQLTDAIFPRTDPTIISEVYQMLAVIDELFNDNDIPYWIDGGTALGAIRHQGMIPWDDDADLVFFNEDEHKVFALADQFAERGFFLKKEEIFRLYPSKTKFYPFIDIAGYALFDDGTLRFAEEIPRLKYRNFYWLPEEVGSLVRVRFGPLMLNAPSDMMRYLYTGYGLDCLHFAEYQRPHMEKRKSKKIKKKVKIVDLIYPTNVNQEPMIIF